MDVASLAAVATNLQQVELDNAVQVALFEKAMDIQSQGALELLQAASQAMTAAINNPPNLGNVIDSYA
ncbi:MAG: YjfB family protein [Sterolibacterium sp.]|nr:YjfB family protein [Sterolibacterium sp.]